jgi:hypothetical protein
MNDAVPDEPLFAHLCNDDSELVDAVSVAKRTLPQFLDAFSKRRFPTAAHLSRCHSWTEATVEIRALASR